MRNTITALGVIAAVAATTYLQAGPTIEYREDFSYTRAAAAGGGLTLENVNGDITIIGVEGLSSVEINGVKTVRGKSSEGAKSHIGDIKIDLSGDPNALTIKTLQPDDPDGLEYSVAYSIKVPSSWNISVENVNGDVRIASVKNGVKVELVNGRLETREVAGNFDASVVNGGIKGDVSLPEHGAGSLEMVNGTISTRLSVPSTAACAVEVTNGDIALMLPKGSSANVTAQSVSGNVRFRGLDFSKVERTENMGAGESFQGMLGSGSGTITLATVNGQIAMEGF